MTHVVVLRGKVRGTPGRRARGRRPIGQVEELIAAVVGRPATAVRVLLLLLMVLLVVVVVVVVLVLVVLVLVPSLLAAVARPRYDAVGRVGVLPEHTALERLAGLDRLADGRGLRVVRGRAVPVGVHHRGRRSQRRFGVRVVVAPVLVRRLVDVLRRPVTAHRVHAVGHALPRHSAATATAHRSADLLTGPRFRSVGWRAGPLGTVAVGNQ